MSLGKLLLAASISLFQKNVIAFLIVRRHDLGIPEDLIRYVAVKPNSSIAVLRYKIWHLLDLPDYCDEVIILKTSENVEIPLTELRKGNEPNRPFILEVWLPPRRQCKLRVLGATTAVHNHMLTMGQDQEEHALDLAVSECSCHEKRDTNAYSTVVRESNSTMTENTLALHKLRVFDHNQGNLPTELKSELSSRISNSSFVFKLQGKKSKDNFANILLKIQSDLSSLSQKLTNLENKIPA